MHSELALKNIDSGSSPASLDLDTEGYAGGYSTFTRALRTLGLRPHCEPCAAAKGRDHAIIDHPAGRGTQWDWVELPDPPPGWGVGAHAHLLVGALSHSGLWRGGVGGAGGFAPLVGGVGAGGGRRGGGGRGGGLRREGPAGF